MKDRGGRNFVWLEIYLHNGVTSAADAADVFLLQEVITSSML